VSNKVLLFTFYQLPVIHIIL